MTDTTSTLVHEPLLFADISDLDIVNNDDDRAKWLELRRSGIGGSEAAAVVLGADPWSTSFEVYWDKKGRATPKEQTRQMEWGHRLEPVIREWFADHTGLPVVHEKIMYQHPDYPFMLANMDGLVADDAILEVKSTDSRNEEEWEDGPPLHYTLQTNHYLAVSGRRRAFVAVLIGGNDPRFYELERDDELIEMLIAGEKRFWEDHVLADVEPPVTGRESDTDVLNALWTPQPGSEIILPPDAVRDLLDLVRVKWEIKQLEAQETELANRIRAVMGDNEVGIGIDGKPLVTWKANEETRIDPKRLRLELPEVAETYSNKTTVRKLLPKPKYTPPEET